MKSYMNFEHSIASAKSLTAMYAELRERRELGQRGRLTTENEDLLWLPRSAVVAALSSLDAYVHAVLYDRIPHALKRAAIPEALGEAMARVVPIKGAPSFNTS
ncbi:MAG: hypothetical protein ACYSVY_21680 [Planctomycetota bacterium]|jgi:hypothetical protein